MFTQGEKGFQGGPGYIGSQVKHIFKFNEILVCVELKIKSTNVLPFFFRVKKENEDHQGL